MVVVIRLLAGERGGNEIMKWSDNETIHGRANTASITSVHTDVSFLLCKKSRQMIGFSNL